MGTEDSDGDVLYWYQNGSGGWTQDWTQPASAQGWTEHVVTSP